MFLCTQNLFLKKKKKNRLEIVRIASINNTTQILLAACRRFAMVTISDNGPFVGPNAFRRSTIQQKQFIIIIIIITIYFSTNSVFASFNLSCIISKNCEKFTIYDLPFVNMIHECVSTLFRK